jgi:hypothetical protein
MRWHILAHSTPPLTTIRQSWSRAHSRKLNKPLNDRGKSPPGNRSLGPRGCPAKGASVFAPVGGRALVSDWHD